MDTLPKIYIYMITSNLKKKSASVQILTEAAMSTIMNHSFKILSSRRTLNILHLPAKINEKKREKMVFPISYLAMFKTKSARKKTPLLSNVPHH